MDDAIRPEQREALLKAIEDPPLGGDLWRAKRAGVDLRALVDNLCLTTTDRLHKMQSRGNRMMERAGRKQVRKAGRKPKDAQ